MKIRLRQHPTRKNLFVSEDGLRLFKELVVSNSSGGYHTVSIDGEIVRRHTLVTEAFHGSRPSARHGVRHKDGDPSNDHPTNLTWGTQKENVQDAIRHSVFPLGERHPNARLRRNHAVEIRKRRLAGESGKSLADEFNVSQQTICDIVAMRTWK